MRVAGLNIADDLLLDLAEQLRRRGFADPANEIEDAWIADEADVISRSPTEFPSLPYLTTHRRPSLSFAECYSGNTNGTAARGSSSGEPPRPTARLDTVRTVLARAD